MCKKNESQSNSDIESSRPDPSRGRIGKAYEFELWLEKYKSIAGLLAFIIAGAGLYLTWQDHLEDQAALLREEINGDLKIIEVVSKYIQPVSGYVLQSKGGEANTGDGEASKRVSASTETVALYSGSTSEERTAYLRKFQGLELNKSAVSDLKSILDHILLKKKDGDDEETNETRRRQGNNIIAKQIAAKAGSLDPTERAAALVLASHLANPPDTVAIVNIDDSNLTKFDGKFLGYIEYTPMNLKNFSLNNSDFFGAKFSGVTDLSCAFLGSASFERSKFLKDSLWDSITCPASQKDQPYGAINFNGVSFDSISDFTSADLRGAQFTIARAMSDAEIKNQNYKKDKRSEFSDAIFKRSKIENANFSGSLFKKARFEGIPNPDEPVGDLENTIFSLGDSTTEFVDVSFIDCNLPRAVFSGGVVTRLIFEGIDNTLDDYQGAEFNEMTLYERTFDPIRSSPEGAILNYSNIWKAEFDRAEKAEKELVFKNIDLSASIFRGAKFMSLKIADTAKESLKTEVSEMPDNKVNLDEQFSRYSSLSRAEFKKSKINEIKFYDCDLSGAHFDGCKGKGAIFAQTVGVPRDKPKVKEQSPAISNCVFEKGAFLAGITDVDRISGLTIDSCFIAQDLEQYIKGKDEIESNKNVFESVRGIIIFVSYASTGKYKITGGIYVTEESVSHWSEFEITKQLKTKFKDNGELRKRFGLEFNGEKFTEDVLRDKFKTFISGIEIELPPLSD